MGRFSWQKVWNHRMNRCQWSLVSLLNSDLCQVTTRITRSSLWYCTHFGKKGVTQSVVQKKVSLITLVSISSSTKIVSKSSSNSLDFLFIRICVCICLRHLYLEPVCPLFWWLNPPKQGLFQSKQGHLGFICMNSV